MMRILERRVDDAIADCEEAAPLSKAGFDSAQTPNFMLHGDGANLDPLTAEKRAQRHAAALSQVCFQHQILIPTRSSRSSCLMFPGH